MAKTKKIEIEAYYPFPPEKVWEALTDKRALSQWFMQTDFEPRVGSRFVFRAKPMRGWRGFVEGEVLVAEPPRLVSYSWVGDENLPATTVTFRLDPWGGDGTHLKLCHDGWGKQHGAFSGLFVRRMLKAGWKRLMRKILPGVVAHVVSQGLGSPLPDGLLGKHCHG